MLFQVEADGLIVHLHTADLDSHILELHMLPGNRAVVHHDHGSVVILIVLNIQEDQLLPVVELLAHTDEARDVDACAEELEVLHQPLHLVPVHHTIVEHTLEPVPVCLQEVGTLAGEQYLGANACMPSKGYAHGHDRVVHMHALISFDMVLMTVLSII